MRRKIPAPRPSVPVRCDLGSRLARRFADKQQKTILALSLDPDRLAATPVHEHVDACGP